MPDPPNHRLFIARTDRLMVVSEDGKLPGEVKGINGSDGTGVDNAAGRGYASLIFFCPGTLWHAPARQQTLVEDRTTPARARFLSPLRGDHAIELCSTDGQEDARLTCNGGQVRQRGAALVQRE